MIAYLLALVGLGFALFAAGGAITGEVGQITNEFPQTAVRIEDTLAGYQSTLGLDPGIDLVELFQTAQTQVGGWPGPSSTRRR